MALIVIWCLFFLTGCVESPKSVVKVYSQNTELATGLQLEEYWTMVGRSKDSLSQTTAVYTYTFDDPDMWSDYLKTLMAELDKRMEELQSEKVGDHIILEYKMDGNSLVATETTDYELADKNQEEYQIKPLIFDIVPTKNKAITEEETRVKDESRPLDFEKLKEINPDVIGWIYIPGTQINYPIVQGTDNEKYLHTGLDGEESVAGSIFLDYENTSDFSGRNHVIYGHNMKNATMFRDLIQFKDKTFFQEHERFTIYTPERVIKLKAISCFYGKADADIRRTEFDSQREFVEFVNRMISPCPFAQYQDETVKAIYTLVTCSYEVNDARTYLIAVEDESF